MPERFRPATDVHVVLRREGKILLLQRGGDVYASGCYCLPSGHLEAGENLLDTAIRETKEEVGIILEPTRLRFLLAMHHSNPDGTRIGFFFEPIDQQWSGEPINGEPAKCAELRWADPDELPPNTVTYTAAAVKCIQQGITFAVDGW